MILHPLLRKYPLCVLLVLTIYSFQSCTTTRIVTKYDSDTFANNPLNKKTTWSFAWGLVQPKDIDPKCDSRSNHMNKVVFKDNLGFSLISVITLGIAMPHRIE